MKPEDILKPYMARFEENLKILVKNNANELEGDILGFLFAKSKRIRPIFTYACALALNGAIDDDIDNIALALELLHSATLVHDDILDESAKRRGIKSFYAKFGAKKAVVLGDYLLSLCLLELSRVKSSCVLEIFSKNILKTVNGEINQFSHKFEFQNEDEYIKKTAAKTANLFVCAAQSVCAIKKPSKNECDSLVNFAQMFGTAFQLKNDIDNFKNRSDDIKNGIYTLCAIYFKQENPTCDIMNLDNEAVTKYANMAQKKTNELLDDAQKCIAALNFEPAQEIFKSLCDKLRG